MRDLQHLPSITEGKAMELILDACRANERRENRQVQGHTVTFMGSEAVLRDPEGIVVALAYVDNFDC